ncbi:MAG: alpha/beta fold hydrolase [Myxococcota bacterium]|nr:alpha/beta fold hydrolase [Myxococcota bacterium]
MTRAGVETAAALLLAVLLAACDPRAGDPATTDPVAADTEHPAALESLSIASGDASMNAIVYVAPGPGPHPLVILLHGYPGEERNLDLAQAMRRAGWNVLFFHYRGAWGSGGSFSFAHALEDVAAAVETAQSAAFAERFRSDPERIALVGHSMGGFLALTTGSRLEAVDCVASLAGANLGALGGAAARDPELAAGAAQSLDGWSGPIRGEGGEALVAELVARAADYDTRSRAAALAPKPLLLVGGSRDTVTPTVQHHDPLVAALRAAGAARLDTLVLEADHAFSSRRIALARALTGWLARSCYELP